MRKSPEYLTARIRLHVSAKWLKAEGACADQVTLFRSAFPRGATLSRVNLLKAARAELSLYWLVQRLGAKESLEVHERVERLSSAFDVIEEHHGLAMVREMVERALDDRGYQDACGMVRGCKSQIERRLLAHCIADTLGL